MELDFHTEGPQCKPGSTTSTTDQLNISSLQFLYEMGEHVAALQLDMRIKQTIFYTYTHSLFYQRGLKSSILISESYDPYFNMVIHLCNGHFLNTWST